MKLDYSYKLPVHQQFGRFIKKNLYKSPSETQVLFLPGYGAAEYENVYKPRGIPIQNITGVEKNGKVYKHIKRTQEFDIVNDDLVDYTKETDKKFDVISLDFTGYLTDKEREIIYTLAERKLLRDGGILLTTFQASRERKDEQTRYKQMMLNREIANIINGLADPKLYDTGYREITSDEQVPQKGEFYYTENSIGIVPKQQMNTANMRDIGVPSDVLYTLAQAAVPVLKRSEMFNTFLDIVPPDFLEPLFEKFGLSVMNNDFLKQLEKFAADIAAEKLKGHHLQVPQESKQKFLEKYCSSYLLTTTLEYIATHVFFWHPSTTYLVRLHAADAQIPTAIQLNKYAGDAGMPMLCDFYKFDDARTILPDEIETYAKRFFELPAGWWIAEKAQTLVSTKEKFKLVERASKSPNGLPPTIEFTKMLHKKVGVAYETISNSISSAVKKLGKGELERINLGSFRKPRGNKEEIVKMVIAGVPDENIHEKYRVGKMQLAGYKASLKKGMYKELVEEVQRSQETAQAEKTIVKPISQVRPVIGPPICEQLDAKTYENDLIRSIIGSEDRFVQFQDEIILPVYEFADGMVKRTDISDEQKLTMKKALNSLHNGKPLNRLVRDTYEFSTAVPEFLRALQNNGSLPSEKELNKLYQRYFGRI
jgi:hypothetical protein